MEEGEEGDAGELCDRLGIDVLPTLQFWRGGQKVWEHKGVVKLDQDLGEGGWGARYMDWWVADGWAAEGVRSAVEQPAGACSTLACLCEQLPSTSIHPVCPRLSPHPCMPNSYLPQACCTTATPRATMSRPRSTSQSWAPRMTCTSLSTASPRACSPWSTSPCSGVQARGCGVQCMWWLGMDGCDCALLCHLSVGVPSTISHSAHLLTLPALSSHISPKPTPPLPCSHPPCSAAPCVHVFPAVLALARNFVGYAAFARLLGDDSPQLLAELDIKEVPTFLFYRNGQEVGRHVGSSRGDLIGHILGQQAALGIQPPPPPSSAVAGATKRPMRRGRITRTAQS